MMKVPEWSHVIVHMDMDAFYPSVEVLDNPALKGKPVIVGGSQNRGVVSSASYEARKFGVHSAQPIARAMRLCPQGVFLPVRMSRYQEISRCVFKIFHLFTPLVEPLSIDEAFLDVTGSMRLFGSPEQMAEKIKKRVLNETGLTISAGISSLKFVAKIASDMNKPDGLTVVPPDQIRHFLDPLPIRKMWGVGPKTLRMLSHLNVHFFKDLQQIPLELLRQKFGRQGEKLHRLSLGFDDRQVVTRHQMQSVGHELTFPHDIRTLEDAKRELLSLCMKVARRMRRNRFEGRCVTLKVRYADFIQSSRSATLSKFTDDGLEIYATISRLLSRTHVGHRPVRLLGVSLSQLSGPEAEGQLGLFEDPQMPEKRKSLNTALDRIEEKFGKQCIGPGTLVVK